MKYKCIYFDFDGTLADTEKINFEILSNLSSKYKFKKLSYDEIKEAKSMSARQFLKHMNIKKRKVPFMLRKGKKLLNNKIKEVNLCRENLVEVIDKLKEMGIRVGIITTNSKKNVIKFLDSHNFNIFDRIITASVFGKKKRILKLMKKENISPRDVLYVGDEIRDIIAAKAANVSIASVSWGYNNVEVLKKYSPDYIIGDPSELIEICLQT